MMNKRLLLVLLLVAFLGLSAAVRIGPSIPPLSESDKEGSGLGMTPPRDDAQTQKQGETGIFGPKMMDGVKRMVEDYIARKRNSGNGKGKSPDIDPDAMKEFQQIAQKEQKEQKELQKVAPDGLLKNQYTEDFSKEQGKESVDAKNFMEGLEKKADQQGGKRDEQVGNSVPPDTGLPFPSGYQNNNNSSLSAAGQQALKDAQKAAAEAAAKTDLKAANDMKGQAEKKLNDAYSKMRDDVAGAKDGKNSGCQTEQECEEECKIGEWRIIKDLIKADAITAICEKEHRGPGPSAADCLRAAFKGKPVKFPQASASGPGGSVCLSTKIARLLISAAQPGVINIDSFGEDGHTVSIGELNYKQLGLAHREEAIAVMDGCHAGGATSIFNINKECGRRCNLAAKWVTCSVPPDEDQAEESAEQDSMTAFDPNFSFGNDNNFATPLQWPQDQQQQQQQQQPPQQPGQPQQQPPDNNWKANLNVDGKNIEAGVSKGDFSAGVKKDENGWSVGGKIGGFSASLGKGGLKLGFGN